MGEIGTTKYQSEAWCPRLSRARASTWITASNWRRHSTWLIRDASCIPEKRRSKTISACTHLSSGCEKRKRPWLILVFPYMNITRYWKGNLNWNCDWSESEFTKKRFHKPLQRK